MQFFAFHGVAPEEKKLGQTFEVDIDVDVDMGKVSKSDNVEDAIDYSRLFNISSSIMSGTSCNLLETLAGKIADQILSEFSINSVIVRIRKPNAPIAGTFDHVEIEIERHAI